MYKNRYNFWNDNKGKLKEKKLDFPTYAKFEKEYFTKIADFESFFNLMRDKFSFADTFEEFTKIFACDLVNASGDQATWGKAIDICKPEPKPEPPKKLSQADIIQQYHDAGIFPFTKGEVIRSKNNPGYAYYEKEGKNKGRIGTFMIYAPNKEGKLHFSFLVDGENVFDGVYKISNVIHESKLKRKNLSERHNKDLKVLHLLKEISRINKEKRFLISEELSVGQAKAELQKISSNYFKPGFDFFDQTVMEYITKNIEDLIGKDYQSNIFGWFRRAIHLASIVIPGESGEDVDIREKTDRYKEMLETLNGIQTPDLFYDPKATTIANFDQLKVSQIQGLSAYFKPELIVYRQKNSKDGKGSEDDFRTKEVTKESCQVELDSLYSEAQGKFRNKKGYCQTLDFQDRRDYLMDCYNKSFFKNKVFNLRDAKYQKYYEQLYRGVIMNSNGGSTPLPNECAFKNG